MKLFASTLLLASAVSAVDTDASLDDQIALNAEIIMFSRAYSMDKAEAMEKVSKKDSSMKSQISMVLGAKKLEKDTAKRAVQTLNDMYLEAEKELDEKEIIVFGCMVERTNMKKAMEMTEVELQENAAASDDSSKSKKEAEDTRDSADNEVSNLDSELDTLQKDYDFVKAEDEKELGELEANLAVMSFILEIAQCKAPALMLGQKNAISAEVMSCQKQNADNGMYLVNMFSNPELRRRVESELSLSQQKKLQDILGEATAEKAMDKQMDKEEQEAEEGVAPNTDSNTADSSDSSSSFVQVASQQPQEDFKTCSSMEPDCAMMTDKVGGMYGDAKDAVDNKTFEMDQKAKAFERQKDDIIEQREGLLNEKNMAMQEISTQSEELGTLSAGRESTEERQREQKREFNRMWDGCKKEINKIMFDGVCAVLNVRKNVLDAAKTVLSVKPDELQDFILVF